MAAFRPVPPLMVYIDNLGQPAAGGSLEFYDSVTDDPKDVYSTEDLSVNLGSTITLDAAGRLPSDVWGSGVYRVRFYNSAAVLQDEADPVQEEGAAGSAIPSQTGNSGEFLTTNGTVMSWTAVRQVPDPTGHSGKFLTNDGTNPSWASLTIPDVPAEGIETGSTNIRIGTKNMAWGTGSAAASGTHATSVAVAFGYTFASAPHVQVTATENSITTFGFAPVISVKSVTATGCTVHADINDSAVAAGYNINTAVTFNWLAIGGVP